MLVHQFSIQLDNKHDNWTPVYFYLPLDPKSRKIPLRKHQSQMVQRIPNSQHHVCEWQHKSSDRQVINIYYCLLQAEGYHQHSCRHWLRWVHLGFNIPKDWVICSDKLQLVPTSEHSGRGVLSHWWKNLVEISSNLLWCRKEQTKPDGNPLDQGIQSDYRSVV